MHLKEECLVADYVGMLQFLNVDEVLLEKNDVLSIYCEGFGCELFARLLAIALSDNSMCSFSDFISHREVVVEESVRFVFR